MAYCEVTDLLYGDVAPSARTNLDPAKFIADAADEIDSKIGFRYTTPVANTAPRPVLLLLKRINSHLATGRLIMAADAAGQRTEVHAYGEKLVNEATQALDAIADGTVILDVPPAVEPDPVSELSNNGPLIFNQDSASQVESFYGAITSLPSTALPSPYPHAGG